MRGLQGLPRIATTVYRRRACEAPSQPGGAPATFHAVRKPGIATVAGHGWAGLVLVRNGYGRLARSEGEQSPRRDSVSPPWYMQGFHARSWRRCPSEAARVYGGHGTRALISGQRKKNRSTTRGSACPIQNAPVLGGGGGGGGVRVGRVGDQLTHAEKVPRYNLDTAGDRIRLDDQAGTDHSDSDNPGMPTKRVGSPSFS